MENAKRPHFLEVYFPSLSSQGLEIPPKFIKHLVGRTSGSFSLTGPSGNSWNVDLIECDGHLFLKDGWPTFVEDHCIQCGDSLVFGYGGNMDFTIQIFDQTSCEKEESFHAKCSQDRSDLNTHLGIKREREEDTFIRACGEKRLRENWMDIDIVSDIAYKEDKSNASADEGQEPDKFAIIEYAHGTCDLIMDSDWSVVLALPAFEDGLMTRTVINTLRKKNVPRLKKPCSKKKKTGTKKDTSASKFIEARAAHYFTSNFPYFVRVMKISNVNERASMKIPAHFSKAHLPFERLKITLQNLDGSEWMVNAVPSNKERSMLHTFCGGWMGFVRGNGIKKGDACIFELVDNLKMRVHILQLGLEGLDSDTEKKNMSLCDVGSDGLSLQMDENGQQHNEVNPSQFMKKEYEPITHSDEHYGEYAEMITGPQLEMPSIIDTSDESDDTTLLTSPVNIAHTPRILESTDHLLGCSPGETISYPTSSKSGLDSPPTSTTQMPVEAEDAEAPISLSSPFPNFTKIMMSSNVCGKCVLVIPRKFSAANLPPYKAQILLRNAKGGDWWVLSRPHGQQTTLGGGWKKFVLENDLKEGDICVFELVADTPDRVLQVNIIPARRP